MGKMGNKTKEKKAVAGVLAKFSEEDIRAVIQNTKDRAQIKAEIAQGIKLGTQEMKRHLMAQQTAFELDATHRYMTLVLSVLHGDFGWGNTRLNRLLSLVREFEGDIKQSRTRIPEIQAVLKDDTGVDICQENCVSVLFGARGVVIDTDCVPVFEV